MVKRFIFDLDGTLLHCNFEKERQYFRSVLNENDAEKFINSFLNCLYEYEDTHEKYDVSVLSKFLTDKLDINITDEMIEKWIEINTQCNDYLLDETIEVLEYLKNKNYSLVVLTNWFYKTQASRLNNIGILKYFDEVFAGDTYVKPNDKSYLNAIGEYEPEECVMIGDNIIKDVLTPSKLGITAFYYNPNNKEYDKDNIIAIDSLNRIKEMY